jgi:hypothetical protein
VKLEGPDRFELRFDAASCAVVHPNRAKTFTGRAARSWPKLYVAVANGKPIYVGITRQSIGSRLQLGWNADGSTGYHGYAWQHSRGVTMWHRHKKDRLMALTSTFISFDYDHDDDLKTLLIGQAKNPDTPFWIADQSINRH